MTLRTGAVICALTALLSGAAQAQEPCRLQRITSVQMIRMIGRNSDLVPVTINGTPKNFLLDTGGFVTQIQQSVAEELNLTKLYSELNLRDITGHQKSVATRAKKFTIGTMQGSDIPLPITPIIESPGTIDGILAPNLFMDRDVEMDFGDDMLNIYSQDHCQGGVVYWKPAAVAVVPFKMKNGHIVIPVTLDGHDLEAMVDTGANLSAMKSGEARYTYDLTLGDAQTPEVGVLNGVLKAYQHTFNGLSFEGVTVANPRIWIADEKVGDVDMLLGMDVLRHLHLYIAFREKKMYISAASPTTPEQRNLQIALQPLAVINAAYAKFAQGKITEAGLKIASNPQDVEALRQRCHLKAALKSDLDAALADCDQALKLKPGATVILGSRALVLYQQEKYQDAIDAYDQALAANPKFSEALFMRGFAKGKMGDDDGKNADVAAATAINPNVQNEFRGYALSF